jgi:2-keto-4-pentenoate hydratase/2-oxohepta-3-ene-1,7-dioic acid hydratase in catechol pathway
MTTGFRLLTFQGRSGPEAGILVGDRVYPARSLLKVGGPVGVMALLEDWDRAKTQIASALDSIGETTALALSGLHLLSPLPNPGGIFCAGANYRDHVAEMARATKGPPPSETAAEAAPWHFIKYSRSVVGTGEPVHLPPGAQRVDWEAELAVVIGRKVKHVSVEAALDCVAGYAVANDLSARDLSRRAGVAPDSPFRFDWLGHKSFDGACPFGPWITLAEDVPDPQNLDISLKVNDEVMQQSNTSQMIFSVAEQISHLSRGLTLHPGDVILTGTPSGVGMGRGVFLKAGDIVTVEIEGLGQIQNEMMA